MPDLRTSLGAFCAFLAAACATGPYVFTVPDHAPPDFSVSNEIGEARAYEPKLAERVLECMAVAPRIREILDSDRTDPPSVWLLELDMVDEGGPLAVCVADRVMIGRNGRPQLEYVVAHELVHWYVVDSPYAPIPISVEEGLAEYVSFTVLGRTAELDSDLTTTGTFSVPGSAFYPGEEHWYALTLEEGQRARKAMYSIVRVLGLEGVRALAEDGADEPMDYVDAARAMAGSGDPFSGGSVRLSIPGDASAEEGP